MAKETVNLGLPDTLSFPAEGINLGQPASVRVLPPPVPIQELPPQSLLPPGVPINPEYLEFIQQQEAGPPSFNLGATAPPMVDPEIEAALRSSPFGFPSVGQGQRPELPDTLKNVGTFGLEASGLAPLGRGINDIIAKPAAAIVADIAEQAEELRSDPRFGQDDRKVAGAIRSGGGVIAAMVKNALEGAQRLATDPTSLEGAGRNFRVASENISGHRFRPFSRLAELRGQAEEQKPLPISETLAEVASDPTLDRPLVDVPGLRTITKPSVLGSGGVMLAEVAAEIAATGGVRALTKPRTLPTIRSPRGKGPLRSESQRIVDDVMGPRPGAVRQPLPRVATTPEEAAKGLAVPKEMVALMERNALVREAAINGLVFGGNEEGFSPTQAATMAALPVVGKIGSAAANKLVFEPSGRIKDFIAKDLEHLRSLLGKSKAPNIPGTPTGALQQIVKEAGALAGIHTYFTGLSLPEIQQLRSEGRHDEADKLMAELTMQTLAFGLKGMIRPNGTTVIDDFKNSRAQRRRLQEDMKEFADKQREILTAQSAPAGHQWGSPVHFRDVFERSVSDITSPETLLSRGIVSENIPGRVVTEPDILPGGTVVQGRTVTRIEPERTPDATQRREEQEDRESQRRRDDALVSQQREDRPDLPEELGPRPEDREGGGTGEGRLTQAQEARPEGRGPEKLTKEAQAEQVAEQSIAEQIELFNAESPTHISTQERAPRPLSQAAPEVGRRINPSRMSDAGLMNAVATSSYGSERERLATQELRKRFPFREKETEAPSTVTFSEIGPGHRKFRDQLQTLAKEGTISETQLDVLTDMFRNTRDDSLWVYSVVSDARLKQAVGDAAPLVKRIRLQRHLQEIQNEALANRPRDPQQRTIFHTPSGNGLVAFLHEYGHIAERFLSFEESNKLDRAFEGIKGNPNSEYWKRWFGTEGISSFGVSGDIAREIEKYFGNDRAEFVAQSFAEYMVSNKVPHESLRGVFGRLAHGMRQRLAKVKAKFDREGRDMPQIFEAMLKGGDRPLREMAPVQTARRLSLNLRPDPTSGLAPGLENATPEEVRDYTRRVADILAGENRDFPLFKEMGINVKNVRENEGIIEFEVAAGTNTSDLNAAAAMLGLVTGQRSVVWHDIRQGSNDMNDMGGFDLGVREGKNQRPITEEELGLVFDSLTKTDEGVSVAQDISVLQTPSGVRVINFGSRPTREIAEMFSTAVAEAGVSSDPFMEGFAVRDRGRVENDWEINGNGEQYQTTIEASGRGRENTVLDGVRESLASERAEFSEAVAGVPRETGPLSTAPTTAESTRASKLGELNPKVVAVTRGKAIQALRDAATRAPTSGLEPEAVTRPAAESLIWDLSRAREMPLEHEAAAISAQLSFSHRKLSEAAARIVPPDVSSTTVRKILRDTGLDTIRDILDLTDSFVGRREFEADMKRLAGSSVEQHYFREVSMRMLVTRRKLEKAIRDNTTLHEEVASEHWQDRIRRGGAQLFERELLRQLERDFIVESADNLTRAQKLLAEVRRNEGRMERPIAELQADIRRETSKKDFREAIKSAASDMIRTLYKQPANAEQLFHVPDALNPLRDNTGTVAQALVEAYRQLKPQGRHSDIVTAWAAQAIAQHRELRRGLVAVVALQQDRAVRQQFDQLTQAMGQALESNPTQTMRNFLRQSARFGRESERAAAAFRALNRELVAKAKEVEASDIAAELAREYLNDPEVRDYERRVAEVGKLEPRPEKLEDFSVDDPLTMQTRSITLPSGRETGPIKLVGDKVKFEETWKQLDETIRELQEHIDNNPNDPMNQFWGSYVSELQNVYATSRTMAPPKIIKPIGEEGFIFSPLGMSKFLAEDLGTRAAAPLQVALGNHSAAERQASNLMHENFGRMVNINTRAIDSHPEFRGSDAARSEQWYREIGNPLFSSWQNREGGIRQGERIRGHEVTAQDMAWLKASSDYTSQIFKLMATTVPRERGGLARPVTFMTEIGKTGINVVVQPAKTTKHTLSRVFNSDALKIVRRWMEATPEDRWGMLDTHFDTVVMSHLQDRANVRHDGNSQFENAYREINRDIQENGLAVQDRNMEWLVDRLQEFSGLSREDIQIEIGREFGVMMERINRATLEGEGRVHIETIEQSNATRQARGDKLAGYWLYDHGFRDSNSVIRQTHAVQSYHYERVASAMESVITDLRRQQADLNTLATQRSRERGISEDVARRTIAQEQRERIRLGKTYDDYIALEQKIGRLNEFRDVFSNVFADGGKDLDFNSFDPMMRVFGTTTGSTLLSFLTAMKNASFGWHYLGQAQQRYTGKVLKSRSTAAYQWAKQFADLGVNILTAGGAGLRKTLAGEGLPGARAELQRRGLNLGSAFIRTIEPFLQEMTNGIYERNRLYRELADQGFEARRYVADDMVSKFSHLSQGGLVRGQDPTWMGAAGMGFLTAYDAALLTPIGRPFLPRFADVGVNLAAVGAAHQIIRDYESQLRSLFLHYRDRGVDRWDFNDPKNSANDITAAEALGRLAVDKDTSFTRLRQLFNWGSTTYQDAAMRFLSELARGNEKAELLDPSQKMEIANLLAEEINKPSAKNRPAQFRQRQKFLTQLVAPLMGWNVNRYAQYIRDFGRAGVTENRRALAWLAGFLGFVIPSLISGNVSDQVTELMARVLYRNLQDEERPTRLPGEREGEGSQALGHAISAMNPIPFVSTLANIPNDLPTRASQSGELFVISKVKDFADYIANAIAADDMSFGLDRMVRGTVPLSSTFVNRQDSTRGSLLALNARRIITRKGPQGLLQPTTSFRRGSGRTTPLTPYGEKLLNVAMLGNMDEFMTVYQEALEVAAGLGSSEPERAVAQMFRSRNPYRRALKDRMTKAQYEHFISRLSTDELEQVRVVESLLQQAGDRIGVTFEWYEGHSEKAFTGFGGGSPLSPTSGQRLSPEDSRRLGLRGAGSPQDTDRLLPAERRVLGL